jgi:hypothetical protein
MRNLEEFIMKKHNNNFVMTSAAMLVSCVLAGTSAIAGENIKHSEGAKIVPYDDSFWGADPSYEDKPYSAEAQLKIYGDKSAVPTPRPMIEWGRDIYGAGEFNQASYALGELNPINQQFLVYGDWQTAIAVNDNGANREGLIATRLRLDIDYKITSTERIHAFINPLQRGNDITRCNFSSDNNGRGESIDSCELERDLDLDALFFEGDLGAIASGLEGEYSGWDLSFAFGLMPLLFQNGVWLDDAFTGLAFTFPSLNSPTFDISNMDITFFAGIDKVTTALADVNEDAEIFGVTTFIEANEGYWEMGYAYTNDEGDGNRGDQDYHNVSVAFSKRYSNLFSNSIRMIYNFGQDRKNNQPQTADGFLLLVENSFITSSPSTVVPYLNLFAGFDKPQSVARAAGAGGILKNTGINFETDGLTGFPTLDASANDTWGGALGIEYLFGLDQQLVLEVATVQVRGDAGNRIAQGDQYAVGARYQKPLNKSWIVRADAMLGELDNAKDISGVRFEIRKKF